MRRAANLSARISLQIVHQLERYRFIRTDGLSRHRDAMMGTLKQFSEHLGELTKAVSRLGTKGEFFFEQFEVILNGVSDRDIDER